MFASWSFKTFDGNFVFNSRNNNVTIIHILGSVNSQQVSIHDAALNHTVAAYLQQVVCIWAEKSGR